MGDGFTAQEATMVKSAVKALVLASAAMFSLSVLGASWTKLLVTAVFVAAFYICNIYRRVFEAAVVTAFLVSVCVWTQIVPGDLLERVINVAWLR